MSYAVTWRLSFTAALIWGCQNLAAAEHPDVSVVSLESEPHAHHHAHDKSPYSRDMSGDDEKMPAPDAPQATEQPGVEIIRERFPNGSVRIEREVTQDPQGNYLNHGSWKMFDEDGKLLAQGQYQNGHRTGEWIRWYRSVPEGSTLSKVPYHEGHLPLISQATFVDGELDGNWTIYDGRKQRLSEWAFRGGKRHGASMWWYANGRKMRDVEFRDGDIDGKAMEWSPDGKATKLETFQAGRKLAMKKSTYPNGRKKSEGMYLFAKEIEQTPDDWWECKLQTITRQGKDERHGAWTSWFADGQRQQEGEFDHDLQINQFTWWHANGQKSLEGRYAQGKQDGPWTWWHANGQKAIYGVFAGGNPTGRWTWWKEDGKLTQSADLSHSDGIVVETLPSKPIPQLEAKAPRAPATLRR